jgi:beta-lactamase regulating signal transducer with metallopeptidase domain
MNQEAVQQIALNNAGGSPLVNVPNVDAQTPTPTSTPPPTTQMAEGGESPDTTLNENTQMDKTQWLTIFLIGLTVVSLIMNIINSRKQIQQLSKDDTDIRRKLDELEMNTKKILKDKYEPLAS